MRRELLPHVVARLLEETKGPLFFLQKSDGSFVLGWGAKEERNSSPDAPDQVWLGAKSFFSGFKVDPPSLKPSKVNIWRDFPQQYFFVPRFFITGDSSGGDSSYHSLDTSDAEDKAWENFLRNTEKRVEKAVSEWSQPLQLVSVTSPHARREWDELCEHAQRAIDSGAMEKLVPARKKTFVSERRIDPGAVFYRMYKGAGADTHFFVYRHHQDVFMGVSPELLFEASRQNEDWLVQAPAIAGTRPRGTTDLEDKRLAADLLGSMKDRHEQELVARFLVEKLSAIGALIEPQVQMQILKLKRLQHLKSVVSARVRNLTRVLSLLESLHPTPAVAGVPQAAALEQLCRYELWERGYFAGPLGFILEEKIAFVVGIRSCLISEEKIHVFAGAGYVKGSSAEAEWQETQQKIDSILQLFGNTSRE